VYDLVSGADRPIDAEQRSIVDQVDWLDNDRLIYHFSSGLRGSDVWTVRVDGTEAPRILRQYAYSPTVVR
jgi:hypothetical protein